MDRKRILKYAGLACCLALCLLLSGCYIAPDDLNNGAYTTTNGALPFQTLAPTPTVEVTPDTVVIETQNLYGAPTQWGGGLQTIAVTDSTPTATPSPAPGGSGGWNDWGTVSETGAQGAQTPTPDASTVVFATPTPGGAATAAPATPTPTQTA